VGSVGSSGRALAMLRRAGKQPWQREREPHRSAAIDERGVRQAAVIAQYAGDLTAATQPAGSAPTAAACGGSSPVRRDSGGRHGTDARRPGARVALRRRRRQRWSSRARATVGRGGRGRRRAPLARSSSGVASPHHRAHRDVQRDGVAATWCAEPVCVPTRGADAHRAGPPCGRRRCAPRGQRRPDRRVGTCRIRLRHDRRRAHVDGGDAAHHGRRHGAAPRWRPRRDTLVRADARWPRTPELVARQRSAIDSHAAAIRTPVLVLEPIVVLGFGRAMIGWVGDLIAIGVAARRWRVRRRHRRGRHRSDAWG